MNKKDLLVFLTMVLLFPSASFGYDASTHAALTREAYNRSMLKPSEGPSLQTIDLLTRLGVSAYGGNLGNVYLDMTPDGVVYARHNNPGRGWNMGDRNYTKRKFDGANERLSETERDALPMQSPAGWLMVGSIREDDVTYQKGIKENSPQDDPLGDIVRVLNHFYDPYWDTGQRPLLGVKEVYTKATDWAIEGTYRGPPPSAGMFGGRDNRFTIKSAREAMFRAATMMVLGFAGSPQPTQIAPIASMVQMALPQHRYS